MSGRNGRSWARELGASAVAIAAIGLAVWEGYENRVHNRLSVVPKLDGIRNFDMTLQTFELGLVSSGLGPAVIRDSWLYLDKKLIYQGASEDEFPWRGAYGLFGRGFSVTDAYYGLGHYMTPGNRYFFLDVSKRSDTPRLEVFRDTANRIDVVTCYCSVYGDACRVEHVGINDVAAPPCTDGDP